MAKPELGAKRQCQNCGAKFFDLNKNPIVCPKCGTIFQGVVARVERASAKEEEVEDEAVVPAGVELVTAYDRSDLVARVGRTLLRALGEEVAVVVLVLMTLIRPREARA